MASPRIEQVRWGIMQVEGLGEAKDYKLFPSGGRPWDWNETGTRHVPGIQPADLEELLAQGSEVVVLSRGMQLVLQTPADTLAWLEARGVTAHVEETRRAVLLYNELVDQGAKVGGLFHSTC
jgi:hypothetical protein